MVVSTLNRVKLMFPLLKTTRFRQVTDFYSLAVLVGKFEQERLILTDARLNRLAWDILKFFSTRVDEVSELSKSRFELNGKSNNRPVPQEAEHPAEPS